MPKRCAICKTPRAEGERNTVCKQCLPLVPCRKPIEETLALIDATLEANKGILTAAA